MSYRKWMKKWQPVIFWAVAVFFVAGVIWWSVSLYIGGRRRASQRTYTIEDAIAYLTKDGTPLNDERYWVMPWELNQSYTNIVSAYNLTNVDPIFEEPQYKAIVLRSMLRERVMLYYANEKGLKVTKEELKEKLKEIESKIKSSKASLDYIKRKYKSLTAYIESIKGDVERSLLLEKVRKDVASVDENEMRKYFKEHEDDIKNKYEKVDVSIVTFTDEASANLFVQKAKGEGFEKAATDLKLEPSKVPNLTHGIFKDEIDKALFSASPGSIIGPFKVGESYFIFKVEKVVKINSFDDFIASEFYEKEKQALQDEKFKKWFEDFVKSEKIGYHVSDDVLKYWFEFVENPTDDEKLSKIEKDLESLVLKDGKLAEDTPDELKALYLILIERDKGKIESELEDLKSYEEALKNDQKDLLKDYEKRYGKMSLDDLKKKIEELQKKIDSIQKIRKEIVSYLYREYPTSVNVLSRMVELFPDNTKVAFEYYDTLYTMIKPALQSGYATYDRNLLFQLIQIQSGLYKVAYDASVSTDIRVEALYDIYEMNKLLKDATSASVTLSEMRKLDPNFLDYEAEYQELESMIESTPEEVSTPSTR